MMVERKERHHCIDMQVWQLYSEPEGLVRVHEQVQLPPKQANPQILNFLPADSAFSIVPDGAITSV